MYCDVLYVNVMLVSCHKCYLTLTYMYYTREWKQSDYSEHELVILSVEWMLGANSITNSYWVRIGKHGYELRCSKLDWVQNIHNYLPWDSVATRNYTTILSPPTRPAYNTVLPFRNNPQNFTSCCIISTNITRLVNECPLVHVWTMHSGTKNAAQETWPYSTVLTIKSQHHWKITHWPNTVYIVQINQ